MDTPCRQTKDWFPNRPRPSLAFEILRLPRPICCQIIHFVTGHNFLEDTRPSWMLRAYEGWTSMKGLGKMMNSMKLWTPWQHVHCVGRVKKHPSTSAFFRKVISVGYFYYFSILSQTLTGHGIFYQPQAVKLCSCFFFFFKRGLLASHTNHPNQPNHLNHPSHPYLVIPFKE